MSLPPEETEWFAKTLPTTMSEVTPTPAKPLIPFLIILIGKDKGKKFPLLKGEHLFGRDPEGEIFIKDSQISRVHGKITVNDDHIEMEDLNSTNGIFVDSDAIQKINITSESRIQLGNTLLKVAFKDPTELELEDELFKAATTDALTGVMNRKAFMEAAAQDIAYARRNHLSISLVMIDADHFKKINDEHGHPVGDEALKTIARLIDTEKRMEDRLGRYGGEEFIMLLRGKGEEDASLFCERLRQTIAKEVISVGEGKISITVSIGFCSGSGPKLSDLDDLIKKADEALYQAKESGRNRVERVDLPPQ